MKLFNWFKPSEFALVGRSIKWTSIKREVFRIIDFDRNGTFIDEQHNVHALRKFKPYGFLTVEWPVIDRKVILPIIHRDDFLLASSVFDDLSWKEKLGHSEILVTYVPKEKDKMAAFLHVLHFVITTQKVFEKYYEIKKGTFLGAEPEILFGDFLWHGELKVQVNMNPKL